MGNEHMTSFWFDTSTNTHKYQNREGEWVEFEPIAELDRLKSVNAELLEVLGFARDALNYSLSAIPKNDPLLSKVQVTWEAVRDAYAKAKGERHD